MRIENVEARPESNLDRAMRPTSREVGAYAQDLLRESSGSHAANGLREVFAYNSQSSPLDVGNIWHSYSQFPEFNGQFDATPGAAPRSDARFHSSEYSGEAARAEERQGCGHHHGGGAGGGDAGAGGGGSGGGDWPGGTGNGAGGDRGAGGGARGGAGGGGDWPTGTGNEAGGDTGAGGAGNGAGGDTGAGGNGQNGLDMSQIFTRGPGVSDAQYQHALAIANALPEGMKQALLSAGANMEIDTGFNGGAEGTNTGLQGQFFADSGMGDQAEVHELYEMAGQVTNGMGGTWSDGTAVQMADNGLARSGGANEGDLNDTVGGVPGDGDHMSNAFVADFFATHPELYQDTVGQSLISGVVQDDPSLVAYIAQQQGLAVA